MTDKQMADFLLKLRDRQEMPINEDEYLDMWRISERIIELSERVEELEEKLKNENFNL